MMFIGSCMNQKYQSIIIFNFFHCRFSSQRIFNNIISVHPSPTRYRFSRIFRIPRRSESFGTVEMHRRPDFPRMCSIGPLNNLLLYLQSLLNRSRRRYFLPNPLLLLNRYSFLRLGHNSLRGNLRLSGNFSRGFLRPGFSCRLRFACSLSGSFRSGFRSRFRLTSGCRSRFGTTGNFRCCGWLGGWSFRRGFLLCWFGGAGGCFCGFWGRSNF